jgi:hypothetical protein
MKPTTNIEWAERTLGLRGEEFSVNARDILPELVREHRETKSEVASVLELMDGLAEQWGDEGMFRRCRDRLRALVTKEG